MIKVIATGTTVKLKTQVDNIKGVVISWHNLKSEPLYNVVTLNGYQYCDCKTDDLEVVGLNPENLAAFYNGAEID